MSGVVLRCPNCGTTRGSPGECEACHEAEVRYYCTNHTPGQWLDAAACPTCRARFGDPAPRPAPPPSRRPTPVPPPSASPEVRKPRSPWLPKRAGGPWIRRTPPSDTGDAGEAPYSTGAAPRVTGWPDLVREAAARARRMRSETGPVPDVLPVAAAFGGCLMRGVFLMIMLLVAFVIFSVLAGGFMIQAF